MFFKTSKLIISKNDYYNTDDICLSVYAYKIKFSTYAKITLCFFPEHISVRCISGILKASCTNKIILRFGYLDKTFNRLF